MQPAGRVFGSLLSTYEKTKCDSPPAPKDPLGADIKDYGLWKIFNNKEIQHREDRKLYCHVLSGCSEEIQEKFQYHIRCRNYQEEGSK